MNSTATVLLLSFVISAFGSSGSALLARDNGIGYNTVEEVTRARFIETMRKSGFRDLRVDEMHGSLGVSLGAILERGVSLPEDVDVTSRGAYARRLLIGTDSSGARYLRFVMSSNVVRRNILDPVYDVYETHAYLYPGQEPGTLGKVVFQIYRLGYRNNEPFVREVRRIIHPAPQANMRLYKILTGEKPNPGDNSLLTLEYYDRSGNSPEFPRSADGIPLPDLGEPQTKISLNDPQDMMDYDRQVRLLHKYKTLLISLDRSLKELVQLKSLDRDVILERALDLQD